MIYIISNINNAYWISHFLYNPKDRNFYIVEVNDTTGMSFHHMIHDEMISTDISEYFIPETLNIVSVLNYDYENDLKGLRKTLDEYLMSIILNNI